MAKIKRKYESLLKEYQQKLNTISGDSAIDYTEDLTQKKKRIKRLLNDLNAFAKYYFDDICKGDAAPFHINLAHQLSTRKRCLLVKKWSRALAKTTYATMIIPIWLMLRNELKFLVVANANGKGAASILNNIQAHLEANPRLIHDFGTFKRIGSWEFGNFITKQGVIFKSFGRKEKPRGLNEKGQRPDLIICDDLDDDELVKNPLLVNDALEWTMRALYGTFGMNDGRFLIVGNLISKTSVLQKISENPIAEVEQINLLDEEGNPTWDVYTKEACLYKIEAMSYRFAQAEFFNNPIKEGTIYKEEHFPFKARLPFNEYDCLVAYTDPSFKSGSKNDFKATVLIGKTGHEYHLLACYLLQTSVTVMVDWNYKIMYYVNGEGNVFYYMEANFIQDMLLDNFEDEAKKRGEPVPIRGDKRKKPDKFGRLETISPIFEKGYFFIDEALKGNPHIERLIHQFICLEKGSRSPDDGPDAVEGAIYILNTKTRGNDQTVIIPNKKSSTKYRY